jgi:hypothetical protein
MRGRVGSVVGLGALAIVAMGACGEDRAAPATTAHDAGGEDAADGSPGDADADATTIPCLGTDCLFAACDGPGQTKTAVTGKVYDPAGRVPLSNAVVYLLLSTEVSQLAPLMPGVGGSCDRCEGVIDGDNVLWRPDGRRVFAVTDDAGSFRLDDVPAGVPLTLVVQIGKWRRKVEIAKIEACTTRTIDDPELIRLPRNRAEGDLPRIAIATGGADAAECFLRRVGVHASEFGVASDAEARIHLYEGGSTASAGQLATRSLKSGAVFSRATDLWSEVDALKRYDVVFLGCEGSENAADKPVAARQALYDYAKLGGRVFASHSHHYWFSNSPAPEVRALATWTNDFTCTNCSCGSSGPITTPAQEVTAGCSIVREPGSEVEVEAAIDTTFPRGEALKRWLSHAGALTTPAETLPVNEMRHNVDAIGPGMTSWMTIANPAAGGRRAHAYVTFHAPPGAPDEQLCGRVDYSDLHAGAIAPGGDRTNVPFPGGCNDAPLTPQQKVLEFMLFDLTTCIQTGGPVNGPR